MNGIRFRWLLPEEYGRLEAIHREFDWYLPHPSVASIRVAEGDGGEIVAFVNCEILPHLGPGWIHPDHRHDRRIWKDAMRSMRERIERLNPDVFPGMVMVAETASSGRIAERLGFRKAEGALYVFDFKAQ